MRLYSTVYSITIMSQATTLKKVWASVEMYCNVIGMEMENWIKVGIVNLRRECAL